MIRGALIVFGESRSVGVNAGWNDGTVDLNMEGKSEGASEGASEGRLGSAPSPTEAIARWYAQSEKKPLEINIF